MSEHTVFIGGGNMGRSLIGGMIAAGASPDTLAVVELDAAKRAALEQDFGVRTGAEAEPLLSAGCTLLLAVKPQGMAAVARALAPAVARLAPLCLSIAAGIREPDLRRWLGGECAIVRTMPNTPALVRAGITALYANAAVTAAQRERAQAVMGAVGQTLWVEREDDLDVVTAVSGSGPAYFFHVMELLENAGCTLGLAPEQARRLAVGTALGAARLAADSAHAPAQLREQVTSPGGTTEAALGVFASGGLPELFERAVIAARDRSRTLAEQLGEA